MKIEILLLHIGYKCFRFLTSEIDIRVMFFFWLFACYISQRGFRWSIESELMFGLFPSIWYIWHYGSLRGRRLALVACHDVILFTIISIVSWSKITRAKFVVRGEQKCGKTTIYPVHMPNDFGWNVGLVVFVVSLDNIE